MVGRPESDGRGYDLPTDDYNQDAWQEFTPWRPGDPSTAGEAPAGYAADGADTSQVQRRAVESADASRVKSPPQHADNDAGGQPPRRWWTEDQPARYGTGDQVRNHGAVGSDFFAHVPAGTRGTVTSTRSSMFGGDYATVEFANGYTEEVPTSNLKRDSWF